MKCGFLVKHGILILYFLIKYSVEMQQKISIKEIQGTNFSISNHLQFKMKVQLTVIFVVLLAYFVTCQYNSRSNQDYDYGQNYNYQYGNQGYDYGRRSYPQNNQGYSGQNNNSQSNQGYDYGRTSYPQNNQRYSGQNNNDRYDDPEYSGYPQASSSYQSRSSFNTQPSGTYQQPNRSPYYGTPYIGASQTLGRVGRATNNKGERKATGILDIVNTSIGGPVLEKRKLKKYPEPLENY
jgi:hypothetical protein